MGSEMCIRDRMSASDAAEALRDLHTTLTNYTEMVEKFNTLQAVTNMVSDALADIDSPSTTKIDTVDFAKALAAAHKTGVYQDMIRRVPDRRNVRTYKFIRFPVVPLIGAKRKAEEFKGLADVDPIVFQDKQGRVKARYLVFRNQLVMVVNLQWIQGKIATDGKLKNPQGLAKFIQAEVDDVAKHAASIPGTPGTSQRERLIGQQLVTFNSSAHRRAPGLMFFWLAPRRVAPQILTKVRRCLLYTSPSPRDS